MSSGIGRSHGVQSTNKGSRNVLFLVASNRSKAPSTTQHQSPNHTTSVCAPDDVCTGTKSVPPRSTPTGLRRTQTEPEHLNIHSQPLEGDRRASIRRSHRCRRRWRAEMTVPGTTVRCTRKHVVGARLADPRPSSHNAVTAQRTYL
jgi:hypothetical protein